MVEVAAMDKGWLEKGGIMAAYLQATQNTDITEEPLLLASVEGLACEAKECPERLVASTSDLTMAQIAANGSPKAKASPSSSYLEGVDWQLGNSGSGRPSPKTKASTSPPPELTSSPLRPATPKVTYDLTAELTNPASTREDERLDNAVNECLRLCGDFAALLIPLIHRVDRIERAAGSGPDVEESACSKEEVWRQMDKEVYKQSNLLTLQREAHTNDIAELHRAVERAVSLAKSSQLTAQSCEVAVQKFFGDVPLLVEGMARDNKLEAQRIAMPQQDETLVMNSRRSIDRLASAPAEPIRVMERMLSIEQPAWSSTATPQSPQGSWTLPVGPPAGTSASWTLPIGPATRPLPATFKGAEVFSRSTSPMQASASFQVLAPDRPVPPASLAMKALLSPKGRNSPVVSQFRDGSPTPQSVQVLAGSLRGPPNRRTSPPRSPSVPSTHALPNSWQPSASFESAEAPPSGMMSPLMSAIPGMMSPSPPTVLIASQAVKQSALYSTLTPMPKRDEGRASYREMRLASGHGARANKVGPPTTPVFKF